MISVAMLGGGRDAAAYYLDRSADCDLADYYTGERERPGRWCGHGAAALSLTGTVTGAGEAVFSGLLDGTAPDGTVVARPVLRADSRGRLPAAPLARELQRAAADRGVPLVELFDDPRAADTAVRLVASADGASARRPITVDARVVADLTAAAGLNPHVLYPAGRKGGGFAAAFAHAGQKVDVRRSGLDVVVSAPKSVSVLYGLANQAVAQTVATVHEHAVNEALRYLDRHASHAMRGHQGDGQRARRIGTDGFVAAAFTHRTSRADDPQLHTHLVVANLLHGEDGRWSAVDSRAVHRQARTAGCIYQAVLRGELTRTLGVEWGPVRKGVAEIAGIPRALCREFSTRREQIECELERTGGAGRRAAQRATYRTRQRKTHASDPSLRQTWARRAGELGHDAHQLVADALGRAPAPALPPADVVAAQLFGPDGLTERNTSFDRRDVIQALAETLPPGLPITAAQLEAAADRMLRQTEAVRLVEPVGAGVDEPRWTSADLLATEQTALALAMTTTNVPAHTDGDAAARAATTTGLSSEQQHLVASLLVSPRLVDVVVGPAGSGKTALVRAAAAGWDDVGAPVVGCSLAAVAARRLGAATGIATCSVTRLLADADRVDPDTGHPTGLAPRTVVVVDEASMVGTRNLTALARHVDSCGGKLVLVGDAAQLPEIDAGGLFAALARRATPLTLTSNQRQHEQWERTALLALRDGDTDTAIDAYFAHGRIHVCDDAHAARQQLVNAYVAQRAAGTTPFDLVALASTRRDVTSLNASIRAGLQRAGAVAAGGTTMLTSDGPLELAAGDLVLVTRNDHSRGLLNGTRATVTRTTGLGVELALESGEHTTVATGWAAEHLDHGYALTVHKAQGLTTAVALVFGTQALDQQAGYVALSRGQVRNHLFTSIDSLNRTEPDLDVARFRILDREPPDVADALAQRLARSRRQVLASHQRPHVDDVWDRLRHDVHHRSRDGYGIDR